MKLTTTTINTPTEGKPSFNTTPMKADTYIILDTHGVRRATVKAFSITLAIQEAFPNSMPGAFVAVRKDNLQEFITNINTLNK